MKTQYAFHYLLFSTLLSLAVVNVMGQTHYKPELGDKEAPRSYISASVSLPAGLDAHPLEMQKILPGVKGARSAPTSPRNQHALPGPSGSEKSSTRSHVPTEQIKKTKGFLRAKKTLISLDPLISGEALEKLAIRLIREQISAPSPEGSQKH